jgi:hypothetical protein
MIAEGQTEEAFANRILIPHFAKLEIFISVQLIQSKTNNNSRLYKGGWNSYDVLKKHAVRWMRADRSKDARFTTMLDLYALPSDFPGKLESESIKNGHDKVEFLEKQMLSDFESEGNNRFIPYLQLHEFEALILSDPSKFSFEFLEHKNQINKISDMSVNFGSPEEINSQPNLSPSKRIIKEIPEYGSRKVSAGPVIAELIGLEKMMEKCPHFASWIKLLEKLRD